LSQQSDEKKKSLSGCSVGIDCEWQPTVFMESSSKRQTSQPVLLLQISLNALEKVYLFDLQTLLRPLRQPHKPMNELEQAVSDCLRPVMKSENVLKVGYQIPSDLRRIAASYPHLPCFREVRSVLEIASLIKRVLHVSKQKRSRYITTSLDSMTSHYLGRTLDKGKQMSNWAARPLSAEQLEYASLDAAVSPVLADRALRSIGASICNITSECVGLDDNEAGGNSGPVIERWHGDVGLSKEIVSWRFQFLGEADESTVSRLKAKQVVGSSWIASKSWISGQTPPLFAMLGA
jgi:3'-5' exonuclease